MNSCDNYQRSVECAIHILRFTDSTPGTNRARRHLPNVPIPRGVVYRPGPGVIVFHVEAGSGRSVLMHDGSSKFEGQ